jgi:hypothetical protein
MSLTVLDLITGRATKALDAAAPKVGGEALWGAAEALLAREFGRAMPGRGGEYVTRLVSALDTPVPRVLVSAWRRYEAFLPLAATNEHPGGDGTVHLKEDIVRAHWELAPLLEGRRLSAPRLLVDLTLRCPALDVSVEGGRIVGVAPFALEFEASMAFKGAPEELFAVGPLTRQLSPKELDFGDGFPIAPW